MWSFHRNGCWATVDLLISDLEVLRGYWGYRRWIVGGHSWGAMLALLYTLTHPERVTALIHLSGPGFPYDRKHIVRAALARLTAGERSALNDAYRGLTEFGDGADAEVARTYAHLLWLTYFSDRRRAPDFSSHPIYAYPQNLEAEAFINRDRAALLAEPAFADRLRQLEAPTLIVHGVEDSLPLGPVLGLANLLPSARLTLLPHAGHVPWLETSAPLEQALRNFLNELPVSTP